MERLTQERPTGPYRADCGHLCNCFPFEYPNEQTRELEQWYEHDIYPTDAINLENGTECGTCYRTRMEKETAQWRLEDVTRAFQGR